MRVVILLPEKPGMEIEIENDLHALQDAVGGYIEILPLPGGLIGIINEEGKMNGQKFNRALYTNRMDPLDFIFGPMVIVGEDGEEFRGLTEEEAEELLRRHRYARSEIKLR